LSFVLKIVKIKLVLLTITAKKYLIVEI